MIPINITQEHVSAATDDIARDIYATGLLQGRPYTVNEWLSRTTEPRIVAKLQVMEALGLGHVAIE